MTTWSFWRATLERVVRTFAQTVLGLIGGAQLGLLDVAWLHVLAVAALAAVVALLTAVVAAVPTGSPGVTEIPRLAPRHRVRHTPMP